MFKSPPSITPCSSIAEALAISSDVSPEDGIITSIPLLSIEFSFKSAYVSTLEIIV